MSRKSIDFGEDVCYYEDISDNSKLKYVKGCPSGKSCKLVEDSDTDEYRIHTCQPVDLNLKRNIGENCDAELFECFDSLTCTSGKCSTSSGSGSSSGACTTIGKKRNSEEETCITDSSEISNIGNLCYSKDSFSSSDTFTYTHYNSLTKKCRKLEIKVKEDVTGQYYIKSKEIVDSLYSIEDGDYVDDLVEDGLTSNEYCKNGFSLYFFGNGKLVLSEDSLMFKRCVTVLALYPFTDGGSISYIIKYKINNGEEHIYDTSKLTGDYKTTQNTECNNYLFWPKLELLKYMIEEYKSNGNSNKYIKWKYLHQYPKYYLLYKDQTDVLDYLIQKDYHSYIPEALSGKTANVVNTQPATTSEETIDTTTSEPDSQSSGFLNIQYFIIFICLLIEL